MLPFPLCFFYPSILHHRHRPQRLTIPSTIPPREGQTLFHQGAPVVGYAIQHYLQQAPEEESSFANLPNAEWEATCQRVQLDINVFEQQLHNHNPSFQDHAQHGSTSASIPHHHDSAQRRRQKRQAKHLHGVGSQFDAVEAKPTLARDHGMMSDLRHLAQYPAQDVAPQEYEEALSEQTQELTDQSLLGVGSQFQQQGQLRRY